MAVQEIGVPTGFEADVESIGKVDGLKKIEQGSRKVILYFDEVRIFFFVKLLFAENSETFGRPHNLKYLQKKFEDTIGLSRSHKSKK